MSDLALEMRAIVKSYGPTRALRGVDYRVRRGSIHALLGQNGAGKSTLLKIAVGATAPDSGQVLIDGQDFRRVSTDDARRSGVGMVFQELSVLPNLSVSDNVFLGDELRGRTRLIHRRRQVRQTVELFARLGERIPAAARVGSLSAGDQQLVEIVKALRLARSVLILDEPTAALTDQEVARLFAVLREIAASGVGIVYVSHRLTEVMELCDEVTVLRDGNVALNAPISECGIDRLVSSMVENAGVARPAGREPARSGRAGTTSPLLSVNGLEVRPKLHDVTFDLNRGEILGVAGLAGSGRSTLLKALYGVVKPTRGEVVLDGTPISARSPAAAIKAGIYLIPEKRHAEGLVLEHSIEANLSLSILDRLRRLVFYDRRSSGARAQELVEGLGIACTSIRQPVLRLSGGNQQKVVLGKAFNAHTKVLLLDEPTYGVDIHASAEIRRRIRRFTDDGNAVLWVTSDINELLDVADRLLILADGTARDSIQNGPEVDESVLTQAVQPSPQVPAVAA